MTGRASARRKIIYGMLAMGWRGSARHWHRYETAYLLLAGLATPLVLSVHTIVSFDFAVGDHPRVARDDLPALLCRRRDLCGLCDGILLAIPLRKFYGLEDFITMRHMRNMAKMMLATGLIVAYGYMMEAFMAWYSGNTYEQFMIRNRMTGPYWSMYWVLILCNVIIPQMLWIREVAS